MIVSISGPPGSGKTTLAEFVSEKFDLELVLTGQIFREMAKERGMDLAEFGQYAESNPEVDIELDRQVIERVKHGMKEGRNMLLEGRLAGFMLHRAKIPSFRIYITARPEIRAERIKKREGGSLDAIMKDMGDREMCERERYFSVYSFDISDMSIYDLLIDSSDMDVEAVVREAAGAIEGWKG